MARIRDVIRGIKRLVLRCSLPITPYLLPNPLPRRVGILTWERWGDAVLLTSLLQGLRAALPDTILTVYASSAIAKTFFDRYAQTHSQVVVYSLSERLRQIISSHDWIINPKDHFSATLLKAMYRIPARYRIGFAHPDHWRYYHVPVMAPYEMPIVDKYACLLRTLGLDVPAEVLRPVVPLQGVRDKIWQWIAEQRRVGDRIVGINVSAGDARRCFSWKQTLELIEAFKSHLVVLFAHGAQRQWVTALEKRYSRLLVPPVPESFFEAVALLQVTDLLVSPDTALVHAAAALKKPVVVIYLNQHRFPTRFAPYRVPYRAVITNAATIQRISTSSIIRAVEEVLSLE